MPDELATTKVRHALLIAGTPHDESPRVPAGTTRPLHLAPLLGKSVLVHVLEALVTAGIRRVTVIGWLAPELSRGELGSGERWGIELEWVSASGPETALARVEELGQGEGTMLLATTASLLDAGPALVTATAGEALLASGDADALPWYVLDEAQRRLLAQRCAWTRWSGVAVMLDLRQRVVPGISLLDGNSVLRALPRLLGRELPVVIPGAEIEPAVFLARNVVIHPTATIAAPVFIGEDVVIEAGSRVGPGASLERRSCVGEGCVVQQTIVGPETWLGGGLECSAMILAEGVAWSGSLESEIDIHDEVLVSWGRSAHAGQAFGTRLLSILVAGWLAVSCLPLLLALLLGAAMSGELRGMPVIVPARSHLAKPVASMLSLFSAGPLSRGLAHFCGYLLPNVWRVLLGQLSLVGLRPRTPQEWRKLPPDHRRWLAAQPAGLIQEEWVAGNHDDWLESMVLDRYQAAHAHRPGYHLALCVRYAMRLWQDALIDGKSKKQTG